MHGNHKVAHDIVFGTVVCVPILEHEQQPSSSYLSFVSLFLSLLTLLVMISGTLSHEINKFYMGEDEE
jgi:hypothetical protein